MVHFQKGWPGDRSPEIPHFLATPSKAREVLPTKADTGSILILDQVQIHTDRVLSTHKNYYCNFIS